MMFDASTEFKRCGFARILPKTWRLFGWNSKFAGHKISPFQQRLSGLEIKSDSSTVSPVLPLDGGREFRTSITTHNCQGVEAALGNRH